MTESKKVILKYSSARKNTSQWFLAHDRYQHFNLEKCDTDEYSQIIITVLKTADNLAPIDVIFEDEATMRKPEGQLAIENLTNIVIDGFAKLNQEIVIIKNDIVEIKQEIVVINQRLDKIETRLDNHDQELVEIKEFIGFKKS